MLLNPRLPKKGQHNFSHGPFQAETPAEKRGREKVSGTVFCLFFRPTAWAQGRVQPKAPGHPLDPTRRAEWRAPPQRLLRRHLGLLQGHGKRFLTPFLRSLFLRRFRLRLGLGDQGRVLLRRDDAFRDEQPHQQRQPQL